MVIRSSRSPQRNGFASETSSSVYRNIALSFFGLTILVVIGVLWVSSVYARVTVQVKRDTTRLDTVITVAKNPEQGQLGGRVVQGVFEKIQEFPVKEQTASSVDSVVEGTVKIINNYSQPQTLVERTRLLTGDGRLYRIKKTIVIPSKQSVTVAAASDEAGKRFELTPGVKLTIPGLWIDLQKWIYAETTTAFTGGSQTTRTVSEADIAAARATLETAVFDTAQKTLATEAGVAEGWKATYIKKIVENKTNVSSGQSSDQFLASIKMDVTAVYFPEKDIEVLIRQKLKDKLPEGRDLVDYNASDVSSSVTRADAKLEQADLTVSAEAGSRLTEKSSLLSKDTILGLSVDEAKDRLMAIDGVESVEFKIRPSWIHRLPNAKDHIDLVVE